MIKIGQIGIGHNHGEAKMLAVRKFPELFEVVGYAEENEEWISRRGDLNGYDGLKRLSVDELIEKSDAVLVESDIWNLTKYAKMCVDAGRHIHMDKPASGTLEEYKADVRKKLEESAEKAADTKVEGDIFDKVIENMTAEIPQVMYDNRVNGMVAELEQRLASQGISMDLYMQFSGQNLDTIKKGYAEQAEKQVKLRLALEKIAEVEKIEVSDEEVEKELNDLAENYKMEVEQIKSFLNVEDLRKDLAVGKAVDLIKESAVIK